MKKAFSLIELSIVILIIGILIAGVTQGSRLVSQMRLNTARTLTNSSPVASVKDLVFWFEPTLEDSFLSSQAEDQQQISQWNDTNPQSIKKYFALKTASAHVTYEDNAINSLPAVRFNGANSTNGYLTLSTTTSISDITNIQNTNNRFTAFVVMKLDAISDSTNRGIFYNGNSSTSGFGIYKDTTNARGFLFGGVVALLGTGTNSSTNPEIISVSYQGNGGTMAFYVNGTQETFPTLSSSPATPTSSLFIGGTSAVAENWQGFISEFILFDRVLKNEERQSIEKYLGQKYAIKTP